MSADNMETVPECRAHMSEAHANRWVLCGEWWEPQRAPSRAVAGLAPALTVDTAAWRIDYGRRERPPRRPGPRLQQGDEVITEQEYTGQWQ